MKLQNSQASEISMIKTNTVFFPSPLYQLLKFSFEKAPKNYWTIDALSQDGINRWAISLGQKEVIGYWIGSNSGKDKLSDSAAKTKLKKIRIRDSKQNIDGISFSRKKISGKMISIPKYAF